MASGQNGDLQKASGFHVQDEQTIRALLRKIHELLGSEQFRVYIETILPTIPQSSEVARWAIEELNRSFNP